VSWLGCARDQAPSKNNRMPLHGRGSFYQGDSAGQPRIPMQCPGTDSLFFRLRWVWGGTWAFGAGLVPENNLSFITFQ